LALHKQQAAAILGHSKKLNDHTSWREDSTDESYDFINRR
jgi:hypothetical protein